MLKQTIYNSDEEIVSIGERLLDLTLPKSQWTHAAHFAAACWILKDRLDIDAARELPTFIRAYNLATGVLNTTTGGYHETITQASIRAARHFLWSNPTLSLAATCNLLLHSSLGDPGWILAYWMRETLYSPAARLGWCEPDIVELPF